MPVDNLKENTSQSNRDVQRVSPGAASDADDERADDEGGGGAPRLRRRLLSARPPPPPWPRAGAGAAARRTAAAAAHQAHHGRALYSVNACVVTAAAGANAKCLYLSSRLSKVVCIASKKDLDDLGTRVSGCAVDGHVSLPHFVFGALLHFVCLHTVFYMNIEK